MVLPAVSFSKITVAIVDTQELEKDDLNGNANGEDYELHWPGRVLETVEYGCAKAIHKLLVLVLVLIFKEE